MERLFVRVLQVESNRDAATAVERLIAGGGATCDTVSTGQLALERLAFEDYDLILSAFALPDQTGAELVARLDATGIRSPVLLRMRNQPVGTAYAEVLQRLARSCDSDGEASTETAGRTERDSVRHKVLKAGQIVYRDARCVMDCTVLNISASGACIQPADAFEDPGPIVLKILNGPVRRCEIRWRKGVKLGVRFVE
ncbi:MAG: response regulator [Rhodospirillales bacterium]|nr:response regulator [Rhodospirillales bacterium]